MLPESGMPDEVDFPPATVSSAGALGGRVLSDVTALVLSAGFTTLSTFMAPSLLPLLPQAVNPAASSVIAVAITKFFMAKLLIGFYKGGAIPDRLTTPFVKNTVLYGRKYLVFFWLAERREERAIV